MGGKGRRPWLCHTQMGFDIEEGTPLFLKNHIHIIGGKNGKERFGKVRGVVMGCIGN